MLRIAALLSISIAMLGAAAAQNTKPAADQNTKEDAKEDTVQVHGKSLALSCAAWKHNQDGSWTNVSPLLVGTDTVNSVTLRGAKDTHALEAKCAEGSKSAATPARSDDQPKHAGHRHHSAEPSDGT
jgi:hypothetical protein